MSRAPEPLSARDEATWRGIAYLMNQLPRVLDDRLRRDAGLSVAEYAVLVHLSESASGDLRIGDLAKIVNLSPSRTSRLIDAMAARGDVAKRRSADDGRSVVVGLTDAGLATLRRAHPTQVANIRRAVFDHLSERDVAALGTLLAKIRTGIEELSNQSSR